MLIRRGRLERQGRQFCGTGAALLDTQQYGVYHAASQGQCTWHAFAAEIFKQSGLAPNLGKAKTGDFGEQATRPAYSVLENKALQQLGLDQTCWPLTCVSAPNDAADQAGSGIVWSLPRREKSCDR
jgi:hypothetical protein